MLDNISMEKKLEHGHDGGKMDKNIQKVSMLMVLKVMIGLFMILNDKQF